MQELQNLNIDGAIALCEQYKLPVTAVMKGGLAQFKTTNLMPSPLKRASRKLPVLSLPSHLLGSICSTRSVRLLYDRSARNGCRYDWSLYRFARFGMGGESSQKMAGNIGSPMDDGIWSRCGHPTLIAYFIYKTKFGTIVAEVNRVAGEMVFTLVEQLEVDLRWRRRRRGVLRRSWDVPAPGAPPMPPA